LDKLIDINWYDITQPQEFIILKEQSLPNNMVAASSFLVQFLQILMLQLWTFYF
jgi:hypothetical protein